jgi:ribosomal protein L37E
MRKCKWCGRENLNVYAYCQSCGRGFDGPEEKVAKPNPLAKWLPFLKKSA